MSLYRIGVDVGGTNTDAAILDIRAADNPGRGVLASYKAPTTPDITSGIELAIRAVLESSQVDQNHVLSVTIGTTHFINALVEADSRRLDRVAVVRLCGAFTKEIPPFIDFPIGLRSILDGGHYYINGGFEVDGREITQLDPEQIRKTAREIVASGIVAVALVGVFSPLDSEGIHENRCRQILLEEAPGLQVVCSNAIGPIGFLERENATILNAAILRTGHKVKNGFERAMRHLKLPCPLYLSQNDGTLIDVHTAADYPIKTFASGPTNSLTGAAFLAGINHKSREVSSAAEAEQNGGSSVEPQVLVVDIGGTTTDVCALLPSGFPRQAPGVVEVGGVRTAFSMPEVASLGLGGGSKVEIDSITGTAISVGPGSVGHYIRENARVFGGPTLTATDVAVALGKVKLGDPTLIQDLSQQTIDTARTRIKGLIEGVIEKMKVSEAPVHVILVGGGTLLVTEDLAGVDKCIRPIHEGAANAVGAAIGKISGEVDIVETLKDKDEKTVVGAACQKAIELAVQKGAARNGIRIVEICKTPLQYTHYPTLRIQVRAVGALAIPEDFTPASISQELVNGVDSDEDEGLKVSVPNALEPANNASLSENLDTYRPDVREGVWYISEVDLELIATGCGVLGTGGGGSTYLRYLAAIQSLRSGKGQMRVVSPSSLNDDDIVTPVAFYGSPSVSNERLDGTDELTFAINAVNMAKGQKTFQALFNEEIGGGNGLAAFPSSINFGVPVVDSDGMGRAFPTKQHTTLSVYGHSLVPCALSDAAGNVVVVTGSDSPRRLERLCRTAAVELGLGCGSAACPLPASAIKTHGVSNSISHAWYLGRAVHQARRRKTSYVDSIFGVCDGQLLFTGKITNVERNVGGGYLLGSVVISLLSDDEQDLATNASRQSTSTEKRHMVIPFQNEFLYAALCDKDGSKDSQEVVCTVPHLISILGQDGEAIGSQELRYGLHVSVIALPAHPLWKTEKALKVGGPARFGLDLPVVGPKSDYTGSRSVIDEFGA